MARMRSSAAACQLAREMPSMVSVGEGGLSGVAPSGMVESPGRRAGGGGTAASASDAAGGEGEGGGAEAEEEGGAWGGGE